MASAILCLDLATVTGWCLVNVNAGGFAVTSGVWDFRTGRFDGAGVRFVLFRKQLVDMLVASGCDKVCFEEVRRHLGADAARIYGALFGVVTGVCEELKIPYIGVPVGTIKKFWCGTGNASKDQMVNECQARGYVHVSDHNEADAIALAHYAHSLEVGFDDVPLVPGVPQRSRVLS